MGFMDLKLLTWFSSICWIFTRITYRAGTRWVWSYFSKQYRPASSILMFVKYCTAICNLYMDGCAPNYIELIHILISFRVALWIWNSLLEDANSCFTSNMLFYASDSRLLDFSHLRPSVFTVVVSEWVRYWLLSLTNLIIPHDVLNCLPSNVDGVPSLIRSLKISELRWSNSFTIWSDQEVKFWNHPCI